MYPQKQKSRGAQSVKEATSVKSLSGRLPNQEVLTACPLAGIACHWKNLLQKSLWGIERTSIRYTTQN